MVDSKRKGKQNDYGGQIDKSNPESEARKEKNYLLNELNSLGVEPKKRNELNDTEELRDLTDNLKQTMFQDYKTAYSDKKSIGDKKGI